LLLHALNTVLLFLVFRKMTRATWRSLFVALLFGLHPLRVESVIWVAERKDVLSAFFWMLTILAYVRHAEKPGLVRYLPVVFCFALGLLSKPMIVTLPFVLLLLDYWPLERWKHKPLPSLIMEKVPLFLLCAASCAVTIFAQRSGGAMALMKQLSFGTRFENALVSYCRYLGKLFWPEKLSVVYPLVNDWSLGVVLASIVLLSGVSFLAVVNRHRRPYLITGWFWFLGTLVPVIGIVMVGEQSMADRYTYLPSIGVLVVLSWGTYDLTRRWRFQSVVCSAITAGIVVLCIALTRQNVAYWRNTETLFRHALISTKNNYVANIILGTAFLNQGRMDDALDELQTAVKIRPDSGEIHNNLGAILLAKGRFGEAINHFRETSRLWPNSPGAYANLAKALENAGNLDEAIKAYQQTIRLKPEIASAHNNLGLALAKKGLLDEATNEFQTAVRLDPKDSTAHNNLGMALNQVGRIDEAIIQFKMAVVLDPANAAAQQNLNAVLNRKGQ
jgi:Flp pilus assembly protein TadD